MSHLAVTNTSAASISTSESLGIPEVWGEKSGHMAFILVRHKVRDYDQWAPGFQNHSSARLRSGSKGGKVFRNSHDKNEIFVLLEWESEDAAIQFVKSQDLQSKMQEVGVIEPPDIYFLDEASKPEA